MDADDIKFEIAEWLDAQWRELLTKSENKHGPCPPYLKGALHVAFWKCYSPPQHWKNLSDFRLKDNRIIYVRAWHIENTYIRNLRLGRAARYMGKKMREHYKKWMKRTKRTVPAANKKDI